MAKTLDTSGAIALRAMDVRNSNSGDFGAALLRAAKKLPVRRHPDFIVTRTAGTRGAGVKS